MSIELYEHVTDTALTLLNRHAKAFKDAADPAARREALRLYLQAMERIAVEAYPWSILKHERPTFDCRPIRELIEALCQVDNGEAVALLATTKKAGPPHKSRRMQYLWGHAAALITILMRDHGHFEDEAAKLVAARMRKRDMPLPGRDTSPDCRRLQAYRDRAMCDDASEYHDALTHPGTLFAKTESDLIDWILRDGAAGPLH